MDSSASDNRTTPLRISPVHDALAAIEPAWGMHAGMPVAVHFGNAASEQSVAQMLGLCDLSALQRMVVKGPAAAEHLGKLKMPVPRQLLEAAPWEGGIVARIGNSEFFLEDGGNDERMIWLESQLASAPGCYGAPRQDASFALTGSRAVEVFLETCGHDFARPQTGVVFTRVAGVSCMVLHRTLGALAAFQLWLDGTYGHYLWEALLEIVRARGGQAIGAAAVGLPIGQPAL